MKMACSLCWDRNCDCSPEALAKYYKELEERILYAPPYSPIFSTTEPPVQKDDVISFEVNGMPHQFYVQDIKDGIPLVCGVEFVNASFANTPFMDGASALIEVTTTYKKVCLFKQQNL